MKKALLIGASGLVGKNALQLLLESEYYSVVYTVVRRPLGISHPKLKEIIFDFINFNESHEFFKVNDIYCCLGTTIEKAGSQENFIKIDLEIPLKMAQTARKCGAEKFALISSISADPTSSIFYLKTKGRLEQKLVELGYPGLYIFRPSLLLGQREENRLGEGIAQFLFSRGGGLLKGILGNYRPIEAHKVAKSMIHEVSKPSPNQVNVYESAKIHKIYDELENQPPML